MQAYKYYMSTHDVHAQNCTVLCTLQPNTQTHTTPAKRRRKRWSGAHAENGCQLFLQGKAHHFPLRRRRTSASFTHTRAPGHKETNYIYWRRAKMRVDKCVWSVYVFMRCRFFASSSSSTWYPLYEFSSECLIKKSIYVFLCILQLENTLSEWLQCCNVATLQRCCVMIIARLYGASFVAMICLRSGILSWEAFEVVHNTEPVHTTDIKIKAHPGGELGYMTDSKSDSYIDAPGPPEIEVLLHKQTNQPTNKTGSSRNSLYHRSQFTSASASPCENCQPFTRSRAPLVSR